MRRSRSLTCLVSGLGTMACVISGDAVLASLAIMVTAGIARRHRVAQRGHAASGDRAGLPRRDADRRRRLLGPRRLLDSRAAALSLYRRDVRGRAAPLPRPRRADDRRARSRRNRRALRRGARAHAARSLHVDASGKVVIANRKAAELFGATVEMLRLNVSLPEFIGYVGLAKFGETLRAQFVRALRAMARGGQPAARSAAARRPPSRTEPQPGAGRQRGDHHRGRDRAPQVRGEDPALGASRFAHGPAEPALSRRSRRAADGGRRAAAKK